MDTLVIPQSLLFRGLERLAARPAEPLFLSVGLRRDVERHDWLARDLLETPPAGPSFRIQTGLDPQLVAADTHVTGFLSFGVGAAKGAFEGIVRRGVQLRRLDRLSLVGPRMELVDLGPQTGDRVNDAGVTGTVDWSRTIGALGDPSTHQTLRRLRIAVVGAGRTGSLLCSALVRLGVAHITLIDPDRVQPHNIPEGDLLTPVDVGRAKTVALAGYLNRLGFGAQVLPITAPIQEPYAIDAAKKADVLVCAADDSAARLTTGFIATAHHRVCCDIGTAVFEAGVAHSHGRRFGADVRIILPLDGCLLCRGGLLDYRGAVRTLVGLPARSPAPEPFPGGRAGSARSWNSIAVGAAIRGLEDLVTGRIRATTWIRLEDEGQGLSVAYPLLGQQLKGGGGQAGECELCVLAGAGDEAA